MNYISLVFCILALILPCLRSEGSFDKHVTKVNDDKQRSSRKYDVPYRYPGKYGDDRDEHDDDDSSFDSRVAVPPEDDKTPSYSNVKGFDFGSSYPPFYKGYPLNPYWKGKGNSDDDNNMPPMNPMKMMEMMMMMKTMQDLQDSTKDEGSLSKFISDSKSFFMAAIVPLSIIFAAVVPVLINYMMTGSSLPVIQTTAATKEGRSIVDANVLGDILQKFEEISRNIETDECAEKTLCKVVYNDSSLLKGHIRKVASTVANLVKDEWIKDFKIKSFVRGLTEGNCDNVCKKMVSTPRQRD